MPPRNLTRHTDSDSEPEREASRLDHAHSFSSNSSERSLPTTPPTERLPLSSLSNTTLATEPGALHSLDRCLQAIEGSLAEIKRELHVQIRLEQEIKRHAKSFTLTTSPRWTGEVPAIFCDATRSSTTLLDLTLCHVIYNTDDDPLAMGQVQFMFRAHLPSGAKLNLAMIRPFRKTSWHPKTHTDCPIREQVPAQSSIFIVLEHIVRGVLLCPIFGGRQDMHYVIDCIDEDMYLRLHNID
ncbi:hypothetical protein C8R44DRAFT_866737 [Mycena epipterygia]|nr:hypothetical protein C8R44DRAFT_866737 [Mycena epipterygia]